MFVNWAHWTFSSLKVIQMTCMHDEETELCVVYNVGKIDRLNFPGFCSIYWWLVKVLILCLESGRYSIYTCPFNQHNTRQRLTLSKGCKMWESKYWCKSKIQCVLGKPSSLLIKFKDPLWSFNHHKRQV